ncbi:MAG: PadR family transcriptional regulator [Candidatus Saccharibacteria bacterium]|nr:PadR family transcriptional regulator [Candidatus Saccharibacteria bacterium]
MSQSNQSIQELVTKHGQEWKSLLYPFLILRIIKENEKASSLEIKDQINKLAGQKVEYSYTAYYRLMARLEHEAGLIEPIDVKKEKGPARVYFGLTPKGRELYDELLKQVIYPVQRLLPKE